jgi:hypothetical protein
MDPPAPTAAATSPHLSAALLLQPCTAARSYSTDSAASTGSAGSQTKASYKARRARAQQQKANSGRSLRLTASVPTAPGAVDVCVDVALERVTQRRQPKMMTEEEVARLLALSGARPAQAAQAAFKTAVAAESTEPSSSGDAAASPRPRHAVQLISDSTAEALLQRSGKTLHTS